MVVESANEFDLVPACGALLIADGDWLRGNVCCWSSKQQGRLPDWPATDQLSRGRARRRIGPWRSSGTRAQQCRFSTWLHAQEHICGTIPREPANRQSRYCLLGQLGDPMMIRAFAAFAAMLLLGACAVTTPAVPARSPETTAASPGAEPSDAAIVDGSQSYDDLTAEDWVTFADYLVTVRVDAERRLPKEPGEAEVGEGMQVREVDVTMTSVLWRRPTARDVSPQTASWASGGWVFSRENERPVRLAGAAWLIVGKTYLMPTTHEKLTRFGVRWRWIPMSSTSMFPFDDGVIGKGERIPLQDGSTYAGKSPGIDRPLRDDVWGKPSTELVEILESARPHAAALPFMADDPKARVEAMQKAAPTPPKDPRERVG
jgi:hypothetical protein